MGLRMYQSRKGVGGWVGFMGKGLESLEGRFRGEVGGSNNKQRISLKIERLVLFLLVVVYLSKCDPVKRGREGERKAY